MTIPGTQTRHFEIIALPREGQARDLGYQLTAKINAISKRTKSVVTIVGQSQGDGWIIWTVEWWTY